MSEETWRAVPRCRKGSETVTFSKDGSRFSIRMWRCWLAEGHDGPCEESPAALVASRLPGEGASR